MCKARFPSKRNRLRSVWMETGLNVSACVGKQPIMVTSFATASTEPGLARFPSKRNARNASDCIWMETRRNAETQLLGLLNSENLWTCAKKRAELHGKRDHTGFSHLVPGHRRSGRPLMMWMDMDSLKTWNDLSIQLTSATCGRNSWRSLFSTLPTINYRCC